MSEKEEYLSDARIFVDSRETDRRARKKSRRKSEVLIFSRGWRTFVSIAEKGIIAIFI